MLSSPKKEGDNREADTDKSYFSPPPAVSLPKGGGAIKGMGEKFAANPVTGTASLSVPIFTTPSRADFSPKLSLSYDSGAGNGAFGFGWSLSVPSVTRKTDKGLPRYRDAEDSDVFILSEAEDLVPILKEDRRKKVDDKTYIVRGYRPRIEGLFARIERWQNQDDATDIFWKSISKDNITSIYGKNAESRIADLKYPSHIFKWLLAETYDDKGNRIVYEYKAENLDGVGQSLPEEQNRLASGAIASNRYLKSIKYGNRTPRSNDWLFQVVFDYGEHDLNTPTPSEVGQWTYRPDAFSSFRSGFDIRTYRLCRRVLMFHQLSESGELSDRPQLVHSTDLEYTPKSESFVATYLIGVTQTGYIFNERTGDYQHKSLPSLEFTYTAPKVDETIRFVDAASLENLPIGLDGTRYQWVDLDSEGISGILTEQANALFYKRNLGNAKITLPKDRKSPPESLNLTEEEAAAIEFAAVELVATKPSVSNLENGQQQLMDLAGDSHKYLVQFSKPLSGYYERNSTEDWENFTPFLFCPNVNWNDPNLKFIDLNGDGHADILISEDEVFTWYPSLVKDGFGTAQVVRKLPDEEQNPALVFADANQSIYLADMVGDGLTDIVRIRNGEICYWPNLGYGRFGAKVTMGNSPWFDYPDLFNQKRIRLADIDGSGTTDIIYLGSDRISIYFNQSGNSWSEAQYLTNFPPVDDLSAVTVVDLLGNGTACLVWSSPLSKDARQPMRYIDLMGSQKPHLMISVKNNMGMERKLEYAASTRFYLEDKLAGTPWITKLPFPVHVLIRVETYDYISQTKLVNLYRYHHGYYDGVEREFRGFGLVEQWDTEAFTKFSGRGLFSETPRVEGEEFHLPPVYTKTWFHTGAYVDRHNISQHFESEYYREPSATKAAFQATLLPDTILPTGLAIQEEREACRSLKSRILRQEIYALDDSPKSQHPYSVSERNYEIKLIQSVGNNRHAVFFVHDRETIDYHYERNPDDPRIAHQMTLEVDEFGNVKQAVAIAYPRRQPKSPDNRLAEQKALVITYTTADFTKNIDTEEDYRNPLPCETITYELTGEELTSLLTQIKGRFSLDTIAHLAKNATVISYEDTPNGTLQKRPIERVRTFYRKNSDANTTSPSPLPLGEMDSLGLPCESFKMAFTPGLLARVFGSKIGNDELNTLLHDEGKYVEQDSFWWIPSGRQAFESTQFYLAIASIDPFGQTFSTTYDSYSLLVTKTVDPLNNIVQVKNNYRVMQPAEITDPNGELDVNGNPKGNRSKVAFDALGMVVKTAVMGKEGETDPQKIGDTLDDPTTRLEYELFNWKDNGKPNFVHTFAREKHGAANPRWQESYTYSDGFGREVMKKIQAEPGRVKQYDADGNEFEVDTGLNVRWVGTGRTVFDNKGNPIKQYEPYFSVTPDYETDEKLVRFGVTPILRYDPLGRLIRTDHPNGTFSKVEFDAWYQKTWDENDTVWESQWYSDRQGADFAGTAPEKAAERRAAKITLDAQKTDPSKPEYGTPSIAHLDVLGRTFLTIADNGLAEDGTPLQYPTHLTLDIEGNQLAVTDARKNQVMVSILQATDESGNSVKVNAFDLLGHRLYSHSPDAGDRWMLNNVAGHPLRSWDSRGHQIRYRYDELQRPTHLFVKLGAEEILAERTVYGESHPDAATLNLRGKVYQHYDGAGVITSEEFDFKGNLLRSKRQLAQEYKQQVNWVGLADLTNVGDIANAAAPMLETERFSSSTEYDALNRPILLISPDSSEIQPTFNEANLLERVDVKLRGAENWTTFVKDIDYDAKGQRLLIEYGSGVRTDYSYDPLTFRLKNLQTTRTNARLQDLSYTYDPVGNITEIRDDAQQEIFFKGEIVPPVYQYVYDAIYRLVEANGREHVGQAIDTSGEYKSEYKPGYDYTDSTRRNLPHPNDIKAMRNYTEEYKYDSVGNIMAMIHSANGGTWTRNYNYEANSNRLMTTNVPGLLTEPQILVNYEYDEHGNMKQMPHLTQMEWDFKDQLHLTQQQVVNNGGTAERTYYVYDASGQRVRKVTEKKADPGVTLTKKNERIYLGGYEIYREYNGNGTTVILERETLHVMDDKRRIALVETKTLERTDGIGGSSSSAPVIRYQLGNHLGSASLELDEAGEIISYEEYYPYGCTSYQAGRSLAEVSLKRYRYTGKERDDESGLYYHGARYYAPWLGRWTSCDPEELIDGINVYYYTRNNPINLTDPKGTDSQSERKHDQIVRENVGKQVHRSGSKIQSFYSKPHRGGQGAGSGKGSTPSSGGAKGATGSSPNDTPPSSPSPVPNQPPVGEPTGSGGSGGAKSTDLDKAVRIAGLINDPGAELKPDGVSGGIPGGYGSHASKLGQLLYMNMALGSAVDIVKGAWQLGKAIFGAIKGAAKTITERLVADRLIREAAKDIEKEVTKDIVKEAATLANDVKPASAGGSQRIFRVGIQEGNLTELIFEGPKGKISTLGELVKEGDTLYYRGVHIEGSGPNTVGPKELMSAMKDYGRQQGVKEIVVEGAVRTTGPTPGKAPKPFHIKID